MLLKKKPEWAREPSDAQRHWDASLRILQKIDPNLVLTKLPLKDRVLARLRFWFGNEQTIDAWLNRRRPDQTEVVAGVAAPLKEEYGEGRAFGLQLRVLAYAVQLRKAVYRRQLRLEEMPWSPQSERDRAELGESSTVRALMARIQEPTIPSEAAEDIIADYWNKLASIAWEAAQLEREGARAPWLERARGYIDIALTGRPNWTPGQLNLARVSAAEGNIEEALKILERILGKEKKEEK